jgi:hypothetical protein
MSGTVNSPFGGEVKGWPVGTNVPTDQTATKLHTVAPAAEAIPEPNNLEATMKSLVNLAGLMKTLTAEAAPGTVPNLILSSSGLELRFPGAAGKPSDVSASEATASDERMNRMERHLKALTARLESMEQLQAGGSLDWFTRIEQGLNSVRQATISLNQSLSHSVNEIESQLQLHAGTVESLKCAVKQNEELIETLVDSINVMEEFGSGQPELVYSKTSIAS